MSRAIRAADARAPGAPPRRPRRPLRPLRALLGLLTLGAAACDPVAVPLAETMTRVAVGDRHTCALSDAGGVWCWGDGAAGQLGTGATVSEARPRLVAGERVFIDLAAGGAHTCALADDGAAYCWGDNARGQVGAGAGAVVPAPVAVTGGIAFTALSAGWEHTCGVTAGGESYCWGRGTEGQLGTGAQEDRSVPGPVAGGVSYESISGGGRHTCALTPDGAGWCWGANDLGQLGIGDAGAPEASPAPVAGGLVLIDVSAGWRHSCAVDAGGRPYCWGAGATGELGTGRHYEEDVPAEVAPAAVPSPDQTYVAISAGVGYTCGLRHQGEAMCWGRGAEGQLGNGELWIYHYLPQLVLREPGRRFVHNSGPFARVDAGATEHVCGVTVDGKVLCWGRGRHGQLGADVWLTNYPRFVSIPPL
ncbi:MAG TPA: hypothetical protein VMM12_10175 [Longimicrobiales bacterium]|nr:hypothetical protein [Longimicrobiales bacterium]